MPHRFHKSKLAIFALLLLPVLATAPVASAQLVDTVFSQYQAQVERSVERGLTYLAAAQREDGQSLRAIAHQLNRNGVPTARGGGQWHASTVKAVLESLALDDELDGAPAAESLT